MLLKEQKNSKNRLKTLFHQKVKDRINLFCLIVAKLTIRPLPVGFVFILSVFYSMLSYVASFTTVDFNLQVASKLEFLHKYFVVRLKVIFI